MRNLRVLMLVAGISAEILCGGMYLWGYFNLGEWWRCNVP